MEILGELLVMLLQGVFQVIIEALTEHGVHVVARRFPGARPWHALLAGIGYAALGAALGWVSLLVLPDLLTGSRAGQLASLIVLPLLGGAAMATLGAWRRRQGQPLVRLDHFAYGFVFALALTLVRFLWGGV